jgi:hypothetical protein
MLTRALPALVACAIVVAGTVIWRLRPTRGFRWVVAGLTAYGAAAFAHATVAGIGLASLLAGHGLFTPLPYVLQGAFIGAFVVLPVGWAASLIRAGVPRFREGSLWPPMSQALALTLCVALVIGSLPYRSTAPAAVSVDESTQSATARLAALEGGLRAIEDAERDSPRDLWDPHDVVERAGRNDAVLFAWVRENTFWVPYHGLLRGAVGVLMDRLGNGLDRAVLLATLLREAGHIVRLAHAELPRDSAAALLPRLVARPAAPSGEIRGESRLEVDIREVAAKYRLDEAAIRRRLQESRESGETMFRAIARRADEQTTRLGKLIDLPNARGAGMPEAFEAALVAARDHWWVQQQNGGEWIDFDLLSGSAGSSIAPATETIDLAEAPASHAHQVIIRIVAERMRDGVASERAVLEHSFRPADTIGQSIVLQFWPIDWPADFRPIGAEPKQALRAAALAQHRWEAALFFDSTIAQRSVLTDTGNVEDPRATSNPFGGISDAFSKSTGVSRGDAREMLSAVWIEYERRAPNEPNQITRRAVFDLFGPAPRASKSVPSTVGEEARLRRSLALMMRTEILPQVCRIAPEFLAHLLAESVTRSRGLLTSVVRGELTESGATIRALGSQTSPTPSPLYQLAIARFDLNPLQDHMFLAAPAILTRHLLPVWGPDGTVVRDSTDIVANDIGVDLLASDSFAARVRQGVLDTNAEQFVNGAGPKFEGTAWAFNGSSEWITLRSPKDSSLLRLRMADEARARIAEDLRAGFVVVGPSAPVSSGSEPYAAWWRVDPRTGTTLGIGQEGWGAAATERGFLSYLASTWAPEFCFQYLLCLTNAEAAAQLNRWWMTGNAAPVGEGAAQAWQHCSLMSLIFSGLFVTLPFLTQYFSVRAALPGGITGGFTLWLRGMRQARMLKSIPRPLLCEAETAESIAVRPGRSLGPPSYNDPLSPTEYESFLQNRINTRVEAQADYVPKQARYLAAEKANKAAVKYEKELVDAYEKNRYELDPAARQQALADLQKAREATSRSQTELQNSFNEFDRASDAVRKARLQEASAQRMKEPNQELWDAKQQVEKADQEFSDWLASRGSAKPTVEEYWREWDAWRAQHRTWDEAGSKFYQEWLSGQPICQPGSETVTQEAVQVGLQSTMNAMGPM